MPGLFQALEIGRRALLSHQLSLQTTGHNIANVDTPGYSRQRVEIQASAPTWTTVGSVGSGVQINAVHQVRDLFLGEQFRQENKSLGQWQYKSKIMNQVESIFNEPNDNTISDLLNNFWDAWSELEKDGEGGTARVHLVTTTNELTNALHEAASQLNKLRESIDRDLVQMSAEVNRISAEIASLNRQIKVREVGGDSANDLRDSRDLLVDELSSLVDVNTYEHTDHTYTVFLGAMAIVDGPNAQTLTTEVVNKNGRIDHVLRLNDYEVDVRNYNGQLKGLLDTRDEIIPRYLAELDVLAEALVTNVNAVYQTGYNFDGVTGQNFFDPEFVTASSIRINQDLAQQPSDIATALQDPTDPLNPGGYNDNRIAVAIHDLRHQQVISETSTTMNDYYSSVVGGLGVETHEAASFTSNYQILINNIKNSRESIQGVSLDEEMANMIKQQHAYDAAARVITTIDEALDTVISGMGIVGR